MTAPYTQATVVGCDHDGAGLGWVELEGDSIAEEARVGQFAMVVRPGEEAGSCGRPYAYFRSLGPHRLRLLTRERVASGPSLLAAPLGTAVRLLGPLGRPFAHTERRIWAVAGGVGVAAFGNLLVPEHLGRGLQVFLGLRGLGDAHLLRLLGQLQQERPADATGARCPGPLPLHVSCDDGSLGPAQSVVDGLRLALDTAHATGALLPEMLYACGPTGVLEAVAGLARAYRIPCEISVNVALPCGVGRCGACAHTVADGRSLLACIDGPTYPAQVVYGGP